MRYSLSFLYREGQNKDKQCGPKMRKKVPNRHSYIWFSITYWNSLHMSIKSGFPSTKHRNALNTCWNASSLPTTLTTSQQHHPSKLTISQISNLLAEIIYFLHSHLIIFLDNHFKSPSYCCLKYPHKSLSSPPLKTILSSSNFSIIFIFLFHCLCYQSLVIRTVCVGAIGHSAAVTCVGPREGDLCGYELPWPLPGAERPHPWRTDHLQQVPQCHHRAVWWHHATFREPGDIIKWPCCKVADHLKKKCSFLQPG